MADQPIAYFITFRCYGTWLRGDSRGWTAVGDTVGMPFRESHPGLAGENRARMSGLPFKLNVVQAQCVETSIRETCVLLNWSLFAVNVRTNHVHTVVAAPVRPERVMLAFKSWATRALRQAELVATTSRVWSRHGSTVYLWTEADVESAYAYVVYGQDHEPPEHLAAP
jgi:REP element-mobilizing transposase RayT